MLLHLLSRIFSAAARIGELKQFSLISIVWWRVHLTLLAIRSKMRLPNSLGKRRKLMPSASLLSLTQNTMRAMADSFAVFREGLQPIGSADKRCLFPMVGVVGTGWRRRGRSCSVRGRTIPCGEVRWTGASSAGLLFWGGRSYRPRRRWRSRRVRRFAAKFWGVRQLIGSNT